MTTKKTVLIADENPRIVETLAQGFEQIGMSVTKAFTGLEAMNALSDSLPDLICIGAAMPASSELTVCDLLARDAEASENPTIVMTSRGTPRPQLRAYYLEKTPDMWRRVRPVVEELVLIEPEAAIQ